MKSLSFLTGILLVATTFATNAADLKFFKKTAEKIWKIQPELFDATKSVPDSIANKHSAVILSKHYYLTADYDASRNDLADKTFTKRKAFVHYMVKLLDQNAVEEFSKHEFGESMRAKVMHYTYMKSDNAFGARIHKPDGTIVDVDISKAFAVTEGKKDKDKNALKRKIDIPGLEPNDVLEYFEYDEDWVQEFDPNPIKINLTCDYPVLESLVECEFSPMLTVEYRAYNDAPAFIDSVAPNGKRVLTSRRFNIPVLTDKHLLAPARQLPFYIFCTLNNNSSIRYYPASARRGGVNANLPIGSIYRDISHTLADANYGQHHLPKDVKKIVKNYVKEHPEATRSEIFDVAWTAATYINRFDSKAKTSDYWMAVMFADLARKEGWADTIGIGFLNSRADVPTREITNWRQPDFGIFANDKFYLETSTYYLPAGELPAIYQDEEGGAYTQDRENLVKFKIPQIFKSQKSPARKNRMSVACNLKINEDNDIDALYTLTMTGAMKDLMIGFTDRSEWATEVEDYLGIQPNKRYVPRTYDAVERAKEIDDYTKSLLKNYLFSNEDFEVADIDIQSRGVIPTSPTYKMTFSTKARNIVSSAGDDMLIAVGNFAGNQTRITDAQRTRQTDLYFSIPYQEHYDITIAIPEGYEADAASLESIKTNISNPLGMFYAEATDNGAGELTVRTRSSINFAYAPMNAWDAFLELSDASVSFNDAVILLKKK